jgi:hypothetical protein
MQVSAMVPARKAWVRDPSAGPPRDVGALVLFDHATTRPLALPLVAARVGHLLGQPSHVSVSPLPALWR